jgi:hypothetical protein
LATEQAPAVLLDRHQERREAGLPTISVLSGVVGLSEQLGRHWAEKKGRGVVVLAGDDPRPEVIVAAWVDALAARRDLVQDALAWLAQRLDRAADQLGPEFGRKTPFERNTFLQVSLPEETGVAAACRWLLVRSVEESRLPGLGARLGAALGDTSGERVMGALGALVPKGGTPGLLLVPPAVVPDPTTWFASAAACLARLAEAEPRLPLFVAIEPEALGRFYAQALESRVKTLIRGGTVIVPALDGPEISRRLDRAIPGAARRLAAPIRRLAADGASDRLVELFVEAARATAAPAPEAETEPEHYDRARSAAERFLFERLETLPQTVGLFTLNASLDFAFGTGRAMEVDLAAPELALAVEIDGYYHFHDADAYRRDRRKDLELQKRGFLVVRILASDVVVRLEEVLDQILAAVVARRSHHPEGPSS